MPAALTPALPAEAQPLVGFMTNDEWDILLGEVNALVQQMEALPKGDTKTGVFRLLDGIDAIHREALRRLVRLFKEGVLEKVVSDPAIHTLMELYDLLPADADAPSSPQTASDKPRFPTIPIRAVAAAPAAPARYPHWVPVLARSDALAPGAVDASIVADGRSLMLARRADEWFALDAQCTLDGAPLQGAVLNGYTLSCPHHPGCHYDVRNGVRIGGGKAQALGCHAVKVDESGRVMVGFGIEFKPRLPSF